MCIEKDEWPGEHPKTTEVPAKLLRSISRAELCSEHIHYADQNKVYQSMITMLGMPFRFRSVTERTGRYTRKLAAERSPRAPSASTMKNHFEELRLHRQETWKGLLELLLRLFPRGRRVTRRGRRCEVRDRGQGPRSRTRGGPKGKRIARLGSLERAGLGEGVARLRSEVNNSQ